MPEGVWQKTRAACSFSLLFFFSPSFFLFLNTSQFLSSSLFLLSAPRSYKATVALKAKHTESESWISLRFLSALNHFKSPVPRTPSELRVWKVKPLSGENKHITWSELAWLHSHRQMCWWCDTILQPLPRFHVLCLKKINTFCPQTHCKLATEEVPNLQQWIRSRDLAFSVIT